MLEEVPRIRLMWVAPDAGCFSKGRKVWWSVFAATTSTLAWTSPVTSTETHSPTHLPPWARPASRRIRYPAWLLMAAIQKLPESLSVALGGTPRRSGASRAAPWRMGLGLQPEGTSQSWPHIRSTWPFAKSPGLCANQTRPDLLWLGSGISIFFFLKLPKLFFKVLEIRIAGAFVEAGVRKAGMLTRTGSEGEV